MKTEVDVLRDILLFTPGLGARIWIYLNIMSKLSMKHISEVFMAKADKWIFRFFCFFFLIRKKMTSVFALKSFPWVFSLRFIFIGLLATVTSLYFETALIFFYSNFFVLSVNDHMICHNKSLSLLYFLLDFLRCRLSS